MVYISIQILLMLCMEMLRAWAYSKILTVRSFPFLYAAYLFAFAMNTAARLLSVPDLVRGLLSTILVDLVLPMALSTDRRGVCLQRILLVQFVVFLTEMIASTLYAFITNGSMTPTAIGADNVVPIVTVYVETILIAAPLFQLVVAICQRLDGVDVGPLQGPIIAFALGAAVMFQLTYLRFLADGFSGITYSITSLAFCWLTVVIECLIFASAMGEYKARRELARRAAAARQVKHERFEIEAIAKRATALYELRHSLANQMRSIADLASTGSSREASDRLLELQKQAHALTEGYDD